MFVGMLSLGSRDTLRSVTSTKQIRYSDAGVNIDEADRAIALIKKHAASTMTPGVLTSIGSFGAGYSLRGLRDPVLVSSADGVGTKLKIAFATGRHDTVGEDLVNHCVNDIAVQGAKPLFFLDYFAVGKLDAKVCSEVVKGLARDIHARHLGSFAADEGATIPLTAPG